MNEELKNPPGFSSSAGPTIAILARRAAARVTAVRRSWAQATCRVSMCTKHSDDYTLIVQWIILIKHFTGTDSFPQISLTILLPSFSEWIWIFPVLEGLPVMCMLLSSLSPPLPSLRGFLTQCSCVGLTPEHPNPQSKVEEVLTDLNQSAKSCPCCHGDWLRDYLLISKPRAPDISLVSVISSEG